jgi:hypothetical protein
MDNQEMIRRWPLEIAASLKVFYYYLANADRELMFGILHPGGGQYYCLSILDSEHVLLYMNRHGSATTFFPKNYRIEEFWPKVLKGPEKLAAKLFAGSNMKYSYDHLDTERVGQLRMVSHMIALLEANRDRENTDLRWGYFDSSGDDRSGSNLRGLPYGYPEHWANVPAVNREHFDWSANIIEIIVEGRTAATYNQRTGEALLPNGELIAF